MNTSSSKFSPLVFGIAVICFFLPFFQVSCQGQKIMSITGFQMVTGSSYNSPQAQGLEVKEGSGKIKSELLAILAFAAALLGLALGFMRSSLVKLLQGLMGGAGVVLLFLLKGKVEGEILRESGTNMTGITFGTDMGFWLAVIFFLGAVVLQFLPASKKAPGQAPVAPPSSSVPPPAP